MEEVILDAYRGWRLYLMDTSGRSYTGCIQAVEVIPDGHKWKKLYWMHTGGGGYT